MKRQRKVENIANHTENSKILNLQHQNMSRRADSSKEIAKELERYEYAHVMFPVCELVMWQIH